MPIHQITAMSIRPNGRSMFSGISLKAGERVRRVPQWVKEKRRVGLTSQSIMTPAAMTMSRASLDSTLLT